MHKRRLSASGEAVHSGLPAGHIYTFYNNARFQERLKGLPPLEYRAILLGARKKKMGTIRYPFS